jgi:hypothetical protein
MFRLQVVPNADQEMFYLSEPPCSIVHKRHTSNIRNGTKSQRPISTGHCKRCYISGFKDKEYCPTVSTNQELQDKCKLISLIPRNEVPLVKLTVAQLVKTCPMHPTLSQTVQSKPCTPTIYYNNRIVLRSRGAHGREMK